MKLHELLIIERTIGTIKQPVQVRVIMDVEETVHSAERQSRHEGNFISDNEIIAAVNAALPKAMDAHTTGRISDATGICIHQNSNHLNVVGYLKLAGSAPDFVVATVMKKQNFIPKSGTYRIAV